MKLDIVVSVVAMAIGQAAAHMEMTNPPPLRSKHNPNNGGDIDFSYTSPLSASGSDYPCKGTLGLLGTDKGKPVANYAPGQTSSITIEGGAAHNGGSCQISLSYDQGKTFTAIQTIVGNCPLSGTSNFDFTIPDDAPTGNALLAWTWYNRVGNRELYMNCASVTVGGAAVASAGNNTAAAKVKSRQDSFSNRPPIFLANIGNGCNTAEGADLEFPDPGPDVTNQSEKVAPPVGSCAGSSAPVTGDGTSNSGSGASAPDGGEAASSPTPSASPVDASAPAPAASGEASDSLPGGVFVTSTSGDAASQPTTLATVTGAPAASTTAGTDSSSGTDSESTSPATPTANPDSGSDADSSTGSVVGAQTGPCSAEGVWNCIGGNQFQRCASGQWSVVMSMAAGTSCKPGQSDTLFAIKKRFRFMRW